MARTPTISLEWLTTVLQLYFPVCRISSVWQTFADTLDVLEPQNSFRILNEHLIANTFLEGEELRPADFYVFAHVRLCPTWKRVLTNKNRPPYLTRWYLHVASLMPSTQHKRTGKGHQDLRLHRALAAGEMALVKRLLTVADLEERNPADRGVQAIHVAAQHGHVEIIKLLVERGASVEALDLEGMTPLFYAAHGGQLEALKYLVSAGANPSHLEGQGRSALYWAANVGQIEVLKLLLQLGCDPNIPTRLGRSALSKASWSAQLAVVRELCESPAVHLNDPDTRGRIPLHNAVWGESGGRTGKKIAFENTGDSPECAVILIQHMKALGLTIDFPDKEGNTPLNVAASTNAPRSLKLLLEQGANPLLRNHLHNTPLHEAVRYGHLACVEVLLQAGVDPNVPGFKGYSPLQTAIRFGQTAIFEYLLALSEVKITDSTLEYCVECKQKAMLAKLLERASHIPDSLLLKAVQATDSELLKTVLTVWSQSVPPKVLSTACRLCDTSTFTELLSRVEPGAIPQDAFLAAAENPDLGNLSLLLSKAEVTDSGFLELASRAPEPACLKVLKRQPDLWNAQDPESGETALHRACFRGLNLLADRLLRASGNNCCGLIAQTDKNGLSAHTLAVIGKHQSLAAYLEDLYQQGTQTSLQTRILQLSYLDLPSPLPENPIPEEEYPETYQRLELSWLPVTDTPLQFLDREEQLMSLQELSTHWTAVGLDLEYFSFDQHRGVVALLQLSDGKHDYILDPLRCPTGVGQFIRQLMRRTDCVKVMHGCDSDLTWLQLDFQAYSANVFDTARAHKVLSGETDLPSLARLLSTNLHVPVDKTFQIADWRIRPLPPPMLKYAREDAHFLLQLYTVLVSRMDETQLQQTAQLCTKLCRKSPSARHQRIKAALVTESPS